MLNRELNNILTALILMLSLSACNALLPQTGPTQIVEPVFTPVQEGLPRTEAEVPRVTVEEAKAALDSGAAVVADVRSAGAYEASHIPGAINIPLEEIEASPTTLNLDKEQWILTYCT